MVHDVGGKLDASRIDFKEHALTYFEQSIHALLVILAQKSPPLMTTDELRRCVENLEAGSYRSWGYYERWAVAMTTLLLERQVITQLEIDHEMWGDLDTTVTESPLYSLGTEVQVRAEDSRLRWRKPHLRCPGYIFNCIGRVEKYVGMFNDPFLLAFHGNGPQQHLYTVSFSARDLWSEGYEAAADGTGVVDDRVTLEVYEGWLKIPSVSDDKGSEVVGGEDIFSSNRGINVIGSGDKSVFKAVEVHDDRKHDDHKHDDHSHDHDHSHSHNHSHTDEHGTQSNTGSLSTPHHEHTDDTTSHNHDHIHESRVTVECHAVDKEEEESPGQRIGTILLRLLTAKGVITGVEIRSTVMKLESFSDQLLGADLVVKAWMDDDFKARLLSDAPTAAMEVDVVTSNANAPTVLQVVECTPLVHHVCVCTLCSCYPSGLLGLSPAWYRSRSYRARTIREPRKVLAEFGTFLDPSVAVHVHDSTADCRFMVLPLRPEGTEGWSVEALRALVTRDSMIGIAQILLPLP